MTGGGSAAALFAVFQILWVAVRFLAAVAGAFVGWFVSGLVVRLLFRLAFHRPTPQYVLIPCRFLGAVVVGLLVYFYLHPGGSGGWGLGGGGFGLGGGGTGTGTNQATTSGSTTMATQKTVTPKTTARTPSPDTLTITLLGGARYQGDGRYYLLEGKGPPRTLDEVEEYLKKNTERFRRVEIVLYPDSVASAHAATTRLQDLVERRGLLLSVTRAPRTDGIKGSK